MSQQPTSHRGAYGRLLEKVKARYEAEGFTVSFDEPLPPPNDDFVACAIARRADKTILIEFLPANIFKARRKRLHRLKEVMESLPDWQLDIATYPVESPPPDPSRDDIFRRIEEAKRVADTSPEAAFMLIWSATEGALLALCRDQDIPKMRPSRPRTLVHDLSRAEAVAPLRGAAIKRAGHTARSRGRPHRGLQDRSFLRPGLIREASQVLNRAVARPSVCQSFP